MRIRDYHRYEVYSSICMMIFAGSLLLFYMYKRGVDENFYLACGLVLLAIIIFTYPVAYELRSYYVNVEGITVEWFAWKQFFSWSELRYVRLDSVYVYTRTRGWEHNSIVCSKIPIKRRKLEIHDGFDQNLWSSSC